MSAAASTSSAKASRRFWTSRLKDAYGSCVLPTVTACAASPTSCLSTFSKSTERKSSWSQTTLTPPNGSLRTTSSRSSRYLARAFTGAGPPEGGGSVKKLKVVAGPAHFETINPLKEGQAFRTLSVKMLPTSHQMPELRRWFGAATWSYNEVVAAVKKEGAHPNNAPLWSDVMKRGRLRGVHIGDLPCARMVLLSSLAVFLTMFIPFATAGTYGPLSARKSSELPGAPVDPFRCDPPAVFISNKVITVSFYREAPADNNDGRSGAGPVYRGSWVYGSFSAAAILAQSSINVSTEVLDFQTQLDDPARLDMLCSTRQTGLTLSRATTLYHSSSSNYGAEVYTCADEGAFWKTPAQAAYDTRGWEYHFEVKPQLQKTGDSCSLSYSARHVAPLKLPASFFAVQLGSLTPCEMAYCQDNTGKCAPGGSTTGLHPRLIRAGGSAPRPPRLAAGGSRALRAKTRSGLKNLYAKRCTNARREARRSGGGTPSSKGGLVFEPN
jgi:hypothetical protein